jgi:asparagine synthase (glutamine-hydrolysing)
MSLICGMFDKYNVNTNNEWLQMMGQSMLKHGIDRTHHWSHKNISMLNHMVCLTTESLTEQLPFYDETNQLAINASCRLFNRDDLCAKLGIKDEITLSDSQIILLSYRAYGKDFVHHILGEFAIVIWDGKSNELICVTDLVTSQPFYYYSDDKSFIFSSEIKALQILPHIKRQYNFKKIAGSGVFPFIASNSGDTYFSNINILPAAHMLIVSKNQTVLKKYYEPVLPKTLLKFNSDMEFTEAFQEIFGKVIKSATRSHLPVCSLLSGGMDSTSITAMAATTLAAENRQLISLSSVLPDNYTGTAKDERYFIDLLHKDNLTKQYINQENFGPFDNLDSFIETPKVTTQHYLYRQFIKEHKNNSLINQVLDMPRLEQYANVAMQSNKANTTEDYIALMIVPQAVYLASFLLHDQNII